jgi:hypothetical protein
MDMKKILQAFDGASSSKTPEGSNDMKKFMQIVEGKGPLNRLTAAESMAVQHFQQEKTITPPVLNVAKDAKPSMVGKYFKAIEQELAEAEQRFNDQKSVRAKKLAERVIERVVPGQETPPGINRLTGKPIEPQAPAQPAPAPAAGPRGSNLKYSVLKQLQAGTYKGFAPRLSPEELDAAIRWKEANGETNESINEADAIDTVKLDVPLLLRVMEYAKEDAQDDMALHDVAQKLIELSKENDVLTMDHYDAIVGDQELLPAPDADKDTP